MDIRHPLQDSDWKMIELQQSGNAELHLMLTKADKVTRSARTLTISKVQKELEAAGVTATIQDFSALKGDGLKDAHAVLDAWLFDKPLS
jgi:GTP-binding protein